LSALIIESPGEREESNGCSSRFSRLRGDFILIAIGELLSDLTSIDKLEL
jgi:hypothetical protein